MRGFSPPSSPFCCLCSNLMFNRQHGFLFYHVELKIDTYSYSYVAILTNTGLHEDLQNQIANSYLGIYVVHCRTVQGYCIYNLRIQGFLSVEQK